MSEFNIINRYFKDLTISRADVLLGIGDDCAIMQVPEGKYLATSTDTLIAGVHFPVNTSASDIAYKALAVNLSDLAAMGAEPAWVSLALTLPEQNNNWLDDFCNSFAQLAKTYNVQLIGGDTTCGDLSITIQIYGLLEAGKFLSRSQAKVDDLIYVSGTLGDAGLGLMSILEHGRAIKLNARCVQKLNRPIARVELGLALTEISQCAIDISDGLAADLQHVLQASQCGANIKLKDLPLSNDVKNYYADEVDFKQILSSGDDYELCFTVAPSQREKINELASQLDIKLTQIGTIKKGDRLEFIDVKGKVFKLNTTGYNHFNEI